MVAEEYALIQVSRSNKEKLDDYKLTKGESYNYVLDELIEFGEQNNFKSIRIKNLEVTNDRNRKIKQKENP